MIVTIPKEDVERLGWTEGQLLAVQVQPAEVRIVMSDELKAAVDRLWEHHEAGLRYLADRGD